MEADVEKDEVLQASWVAALASPAKKACTSRLVDIGGGKVRHSRRKCQEYL
jgi:hypothetical protein